MDKGKSDFPVKLEASATAKANFEVKGEIPSSALGRLVNAFTDAISPFTERQGLKGDFLRLQRVEVAEQIASKAQMIVKARGEEVRSIPDRVLIPLLEKASYETVDSEMCSWWAALLASTSLDITIQQPIFADVSAKMTSDEVKYLAKTLKQVEDGNRIIKPPSLIILFDEVVISRCHTAIDLHNENNDILAGKRDIESYRSEMRTILMIFIKRATEKGFVIESLKFQVANLLYKPDLDCANNGNERTERDILDVLLAIGVYQKTSYSFTPPTPFIGEYSCYVDALSLTSIGRGLLKVCGVL